MLALLDGKAATLKAALIAAEIALIPTAAIVAVAMVLHGCHG